MLINKKKVKMRIEKKKRREGHTWRIEGEKEKKEREGHFFLQKRKREEEKEMLICYEIMDSGILIWGFFYRWIIKY
jgi:hypothetical protein